MVSKVAHGTERVNLPKLYTGLALMCVLHLLHIVEVFHGWVCACSAAGAPLPQQP